MTDRPHFLDDLADQLAIAEARLHLRRRVAWLVVAATLLTVGGVGAGATLVGRGAGSLVVTDERSVVPLADPGHLAGEDTLGDGCLPEPTRTSADGLVGLPVDELWPLGFRDGFRATEPVFTVVTGETLEGEWYAIGAMVESDAGRVLGMGVWLMPDPIVAYAGSGVAPLDDLTPDPSIWHLYAHNDLAREVTIWRPSEVELSEPDPEPILFGCLEAG